jgi:hypothetical protein
LIVSVPRLAAQRTDARNAIRPLLLVVVSLYFFPIACANSASEVAQLDSVVGLIERLEVGEGVLQLVTLKEPTGQIRSFEVDSKMALSVDLQHLELHRETNTPVTLRLQRVGGELRVIAIDD